RNEEDVALPDVPRLPEPVNGEAPVFDGLVLEGLVDLVAEGVGSDDADRDGRVVFFKSLRRPIDILGESERKAGLDHVLRKTRGGLLALLSRRGGGHAAE